MTRIKTCTSLDGKPNNVCGDDCLPDCAYIPKIKGKTVYGSLISHPGRIYTDNKTLDECQRRNIFDEVINSQSFKDRFDEQQDYLDNIKATDAKGHKCFCGVWLCETPDEIQCPDCKEGFKQKGWTCWPPMGSALLVSRCSNCDELIYTSYTPEGSSV